MTDYINFFPGDSKNERSIEVSAVEAYGKAVDLGDFLDSMLKGMTSSIALDGIKAAIEDGALLGQIKHEYGFSDDELQEMVEELHDAI